MSDKIEEPPKPPSATNSLPALGPTGNDKATSQISLPSPGISVQFHGDDQAQQRPVLAPSFSAPAAQKFQSPIRHHRRTPSQHREVKETLNARFEYGDDDEGHSHKINQYTIKDEIGRGSYGAVHLGVDQFGKEYAVKEFSKSRLRKRAQSNILRQGRGPGGRPRPMRIDRDAQQQKDALYLIREEIAIMKKLDHQNLVRLIEVLDDPNEDSLYMVLEMCQKGVVMKVGLGEPADPYPEEQCRHWFRDLILGIEYLHAQGVVHRDIKPDNLLLTDDDVLKIVDFGVSEMFEKPGDPMQTAKSAGSPAFFPPELCVARHGNVSGTACDIWSMGVSLYCLRYGRIPFEQSGVLEMYDAIKNQDVAIPETEGAEFRDLMSRLLEKDPEKRITMRELREHPWVTKGGSDNLLSERDNCAALVDPPNDLEVNHALTRKMSHLLSVMKAINKFRGLIKSRTNTPTRLTPDPPDPDRTPRASLIPSHKSQNKPTSSTPSQDDTTATHLLEERRKFHAQRSSTDGSKGHAHSPLDSPPPLLGIGAGGRDDFASGGSTVTHTADGAVAESPSAVEFNVYDTAYAAEIERIQSQANEKKGSRPTMFMTRLLGSVVDKVSKLDDVVDKVSKSEDIVGQQGREGEERPGVMRSSASAAASVISDTAARIGNAVDETRTATVGQGQRFAELVLQAARGEKAKEAGGKEERDG